MHSVHFLGSITKVPPFSKIATFGHSGSQAEQLVHCEAMILNGISCLLEISGCRNQRALADRGVATFDMLNLAAVDLIEIRLEPGDCRFLDELVSVLIDRLDAGPHKVALRAATDLGHENGVAVVDGADDGRKAVLLAIAALAVEIDATVTDELGARGRELVDLELLGMAEMLVDEARTLGRHRHQELDVAAFTGKLGELVLLGRDLGDTLLLDLGLIGLARLEVVFDLHFHDLLGGRLITAVITDQAEG